MNNVWDFSFSLLVLAQVASGFQWTSSEALPNNARIPACVGQDVTLPWKCTLNSSEILIDVEWYYNPNDGTGEVFLGTLVRDHFLPETGVNQNIQYLGGVGIRLLSANLSYRGSYLVRVNMNVNGNVRQETQSITLDVTETPITTDGHLRANLQGAKFMNSSQQYQLILTCGNFSSVWHSYVDVIWTTPDNQTLSSTYHQNGQYALALPNPFVEGEYTCSIDRSSPVALCLSNSSHQQSDANVFVDRTEGRLELMESETQSLRTKEMQMDRQIRTLQADNAVSHDKIRHLTHLINQYQIRLVGGQIVGEGRVEIRTKGVWGRVCDDHWNKADAEVVCRQLGFSPANAAAYYNARFGQGIGLIHIDYVLCHGSEDTLLDCQVGRNDSGNSDHGKDVGVRCIDEIRLVGGQTDREGRVEIYANGVWETVCDNSWDNADAQVVCRQLGYSPSNAEAYSSAHFGQGTGPIHMDEVNCQGSEHSLLDCPFGGFDHENCSHGQDAGVRCIDEIRLMGAQRPGEGRVEIYANGEWGTVCDDDWDTADAEVVCRQLGYSPFNAVAYSDAYFGQGTGPIHMDDVQCLGSEDRLLDCPFGGIDHEDCRHSEDAGVMCFDEIRLVGGQIASEGRVEINANGVWGTVCDNSWDNADAEVVCRQLGYFPFNATAYSNAHFGQGTGPIYINDVNCYGSEHRLLDCPFWGIDQENCEHSEEAGVRCTAAIRLVNGRSPTEGRVEIFVNGVWGTVCDDGIDVSIARVVCRELGYSTTNPTVYSNAHFGLGSGPIHMDGVDCHGSESRLLECPYNGLGNNDCSHSEDMGVMCSCKAFPIICAVLTYGTHFHIFTNPSTDKARRHR